MQGKVMSQILPTRLRPGASLQLVVPSFDGHLYVIDGITGKSLSFSATNSLLQGHLPRT